MNVGEFGIKHYFNVNFDLSGFTSLSLEFTRPGGTTFTRHQDAVSVPTTPYVSPSDGTLLAKQYTSYTFRDGDLAIPGTYTVRLTYTDAAMQLVSSIGDFEVSP